MQTNNNNNIEQQHQMLHVALKSHMAWGKKLLVGGDGPYATVVVVVRVV